MKMWHRGLSVVFLAVVLMGLRGAAQESLPPEVLANAYAGIIFHNGKILTADDSFTIAEAVAIHGEKFMAVGDSARILRMKGPKTQVIDLQGKTMMPGLIDTHFHLHNYVVNPYVNGVGDLFPVILAEELEGDYSKESMLRVLRRKAQELGPREGWHVFTDSRSEGHAIVENKMFPMLTQEDLDEAFPGEQPAAVGPSHGNNYSSYTVNTAGMKIVLERIPPKTAGIVKDPQTGKPTGELKGDAASLFGRGILPWPDMNLAMQFLEKGIPLYTAQGLTMIQTKTTGWAMAGLRELWKRGQMPIRWRANIDMGPDTEVWFKHLGNLSDLGDPWFRITSGPGGIPRDYWDATYEKAKDIGYSEGRESSAAARPTRERPQEKTDAYLAAKYGWSTSNVHNLGDLSTDAYLTEVEKGLQDRLYESTGQRFATDHSLMLAPQTPGGNQFERMKKLGVIPSMNPRKLLGADPYGRGDDPNSPLNELDILTMGWGREKVAKMLPVKSLIKAGFKPTSESDSWYFPASYPLWHIEKLITRKDDQYGVVWGPDERVSRQEALWMKTNWAASYTGDERDLGTIEPGKLADLVILDQDYMSVPEDEISEIEVLITMINGKVIYDATKERLPRPAHPDEWHAKRGSRLIK